MLISKSDFHISNDEPDSEGFLLSYEKPLFLE